VTSYRLFPSADGPAAVTSGYRGPFLAGVAFSVTTWGTWLEGFWWWVAADADAGPQRFALWQLYDSAATQAAATAGLVPGSVAQSAPLVPGRWNYVPLDAPVALTPAIPYVAATGWTVVNGFSLGHGQFGPAGPYADGIAQGPLVAYSDAGAGRPVPEGWASQGLFATSGADPAATLPANGDSSDPGSNFWIDVQVSDAAPAGAARRLWPALPVPPSMFNDDVLPFTVTTQFTLSAPCTVNRIWFYSPQAVRGLVAATQLPAEAGIYDQQSRSLVAGTRLAPPAWSGPPGRGWVSCEYDGLALPAGSYRAAVCSGPVSGSWNNATRPYFTTGLAAAGITAGPLAAPGEPAAGAPGQGAYHLGADMAWPDTYAAGDGGGPCYWVDIEVTPPGGPPPAAEGGPLQLTFFP
jgi:hypothetical protein